VKAVYTELHRSHDPQFFLVRGVVKRTTEQPERADRLLAGLRAGKHQLVEPTALVVALGLDASEHDPLAGLAVTTAGFRRIGAALARFGLPTVLVQEGGYLSDILGANLTSVLAGFEEAR
jgi:acetoin utilization deacetylase AcuC-like enzyme